jgi:dethiobiotin synthetase
LRNEDALALQAAMTEPLDYAEINPVALEPAIAPHVAAQEAGIALGVAALAAHCRAVLARPHDFALIEGAGGWRVPLNATETLADLAIALGAPVILVVGMRLGCINHALLSAEAIRRDGLRLAGWVANHVEPVFPRADASFATLAEGLGAPCLGRIPYQEEPGAAAISGCLDLDTLRR